MQHNNDSLSHVQEVCLLLYSQGGRIFPSHKLSDIAKNPIKDDAFKYFNIYLICKRSRIAFVPNSLQMVGDSLVGRLEVEEARERRLVKFSLPLGTNVGAGISISNESENPYEEVVFDTPSGKQSTRITAVLQHGTIQDNSIKNLEVMYVGRGGGKDGTNRTAIERLNEGHQKLQKVQADISYSERHKEIQIVTFDYCWQQVSSRMSEEKYNTKEVGSKNPIDFQISREDRVLLAEALLIKYFDPIYNDRDERPFKSVLEAGFTGLEIKVDTVNLNANLFSRTAGPATLHIARFDLYAPSQKSSFFRGLPIKPIPLYK